MLGIPSEKNFNNDALYQLSASFKEKQLVAYVEVIDSAKVPIIKLDHKESGISVDICCNNDSGLATGKIVRKFIRQYPAVRHLSMVLKIFLVTL